MDKKACNSSQDAEVRKGPWTMEEDLILINYIANHGEGVWNSLAKSAGLKRTGKSCRLRWLNYLRPDVRRGNITPEEQLLIMELHAKWGNRWSKIAKHLPGRTDNEIKNYWRTRIQKHIKQAENFTGESCGELNDNFQGSTSHHQMESVAIDHHHHGLENYSPSSFPSNEDFQRSMNNHPHQALTGPSSSSSVSVPNLPGESNDNLWGMEDLWSMQLLNGE